MWTEVDAGIIHASAGPTSAAQFAIIADLERSLMYCKQVIAEQGAKLHQMETTATAAAGDQSFAPSPRSKGTVQCLLHTLIFLHYVIVILIFVLQRQQQQSRSMRRSQRGPPVLLLLRQNT